MNGQYVAHENMRIRLGDNPYPGRGIVLGTSRDGRELVQIYWIMGRHEKSRNRVFIESGGQVSTVAADPSKAEGPRNIFYYNAMDESLKKIFIVSNGIQTDTVLRKMANGQSLMDSLYEFSYESDEPDFTPRITGAWSRNFEGFYVADLALLRKAESSDESVRFHFQYESIPRGFGYCLTTYLGDGDPLPAFQGEPFLVCVPPYAIESMAYDYWEYLNVDNRVSLAVKYINRDTSQSKIFIINRYKQVK